MIDLNLDEIRQRFDDYRDHHLRAAVRGWSCCSAHPPADQVPALLAEVERLRADTADDMRALRDAEGVFAALRAENANLREQLDRANTGRQQLAEELAAAADSAAKVGRPRRAQAPIAANGCDWCSVEPGETHRYPGCMGIAEGEALCAAGIHEADGGCCPERDRELAQVKAADPEVGA